MCNTSSFSNAHLHLFKNSCTWDFAQLLAVVGWLQGEGGRRGEGVVPGLVWKTIQHFPEGTDVDDDDELMLNVFRCQLTY